MTRDSDSESSEALEFLPVRKKRLRQTKMVTLATKHNSSAAA